MDKDVLKLTILVLLQPRNSQGIFKSRFSFEHKKIYHVSVA